MSAHPLVLRIWYQFTAGWVNRFLGIAIRASLSPPMVVLRVLLIFKLLLIPSFFLSWLIVHKIVENKLARKQKPWTKHNIQKKEN